MSITLGREIKRARAVRGWKQLQLHEATGISQKYLSRIENDKADPSWSTVCKIAQVLPLDLQSVIESTGETNDVPTPQPTTKRQRTRKAAPVAAHVETAMAP